MRIKNISLPLYRTFNLYIMTIKGVSIGDKFISTTNRKSKRVSTVTDFIECKSLITGEVKKVLCISQHDFMGQVMKEEVSFTTVLRNKVNEA